MNITTFRNVLPFLLDAKITPWIWGHHAKGKTQTVETFAKEQGWLCFNFRLNTQSDVGDFLGLQDFETDEKGKKISSSFFKPDWLQQSFDFCKKNPDKRAIVFIDEINRAPRMDLIGPVFQMALDHRLHTYEFPENLGIVVAANPDTGNYSVLSLDDKALLSRFCHIHFNPSKDEWFSYVTDKPLFNNEIIGFLRDQPEFLEEQDLETFSIKEYAKPDRRKWEMVNKVMNNKTLNESDKSELLYGLVGIEATSALRKYQESQEKPFDALDILDNYSNIQTKVKKLVKANRTDSVHQTCIKIEEYLKADAKPTVEQVSNLVDFLADIPLDIMFKTTQNVYILPGLFDVLEAPENTKLNSKLEKILIKAKGQTAPKIDAVTDSGEVSGVTTETVLPTKTKRGPKPKKKTV